MIVVVGSLNMDLVVRVPSFPAPGETLLGSDYARHPGGKGANQAVAAARAGGTVAMIGRVGRDAFGEALTRGLATDGVAVHAILPVTDAPTGVAFISVDAAGQNCIIVSPGANARLAPEDVLQAHLEEATVVLLQLEIPLETALHAARLGRRAGARIVLNLAPAQPIEPARLRDVDLLLVNEREAAAIGGATVDQVAHDPVRAAADLVALVPAVVLTLGDAGAAWAEGGSAGIVPGFAVDAVDTTAAGDAFAGALAVRCALGEPLDRAVRFANAAGALAATVAGAQPSLPFAHQITALLDEGIRQDATGTSPNPRP